MARKCFSLLLELFSLRELDSRINWFDSSNVQISTNYTKKRRHVGFEMFGKYKKNNFKSASIYFETVLRAVLKQMRAKKIE